MANPVLTSDTTPTLDWADVSGANLYHAQISLYADFSTVAAENTALGTSTYTPAALSTDNSKYYWRWRYSTDGGTTWSVWSEKYSFWLYSSFSGSVTPSTARWIFVAPTPLALTDSYTLAIFPEYRIDEEQINRAQRRNLAGDMLSELITVKGRISLIHEGAFISKAQQNEIRRFYAMGTGFYLVASLYNGTEYFENVWKVVFTRPPEFNQLAVGREDWFTTVLEFEEV